MIKITKKRVAVFVALLCLILSVSVLFISASIEAMVGISERDEIKLTSQETEELRIDADSSVSYKIIFSTGDNILHDTNLAQQLSGEFMKLGLTVYSRSDLEAEGEFEILLGNTNRALSVELANAISKQNTAEKLVWAIAECDGKVAYTANSNTAFVRGVNDLLAFFKDGGFVIPKGTRVIKTLSLEEYEQELLDKEKEKEEEYVESLKAKNDAFSTDLFYKVDTSTLYNLDTNRGGKGDKYPNIAYGAEVSVRELLELPTDDFDAPHAYPMVSEHPYLYFTKERIDDILKMLDDPEFEAAKEQLYKYADSENFTGKFTEKVGASGMTYAWDYDIIAQLEARAFVYALTGIEKYGYEAIIGAKNAILTVKTTTDLHTDPCNITNRLMDIITKVYDWCYNLMDDEDKLQIALGIQNKLFANAEYNLFCEGQGLTDEIPYLSAVSGHGTGSAFIRKYVQMALVLYNEAPTWWEYIGGKYFQDYVPAFSSYYVSGWGSQGTANEGYGPAKYGHVIISAFSIDIATGYRAEHATDQTGIYRTAYYFLSHLTGEDRYFTTGDGPRYQNGSPVGYQVLLLTAAIYKDAALYNAARYYSQGFSKFDYKTLNEMTVPMVFIFSSYVPEAEREKYSEKGDGIDLIQYFESPNGTMSVRNSWDENAAVTYMKIGERTLANHDLADHGTFQIYYKGLLAGVSGSYKQYGSYVHKYYLQATVSSNGLLIFDPSLADDEPIYEKKADGSDNKDIITNHKRYYYSGGQRQLSEAGTLDTWLTDKYDMGKVIGADYDYYVSDSPHYAYIAGDLTAAYPSETVNYVGRRMLTVYTNNEAVPMLFFVSDLMTSKGSDFTKTFLLHTMTEPTVSSDGMSAEVYGISGGKLSIKVIGNTAPITKIGGEGYAYWINGKNCVDTYAKDDQADEIWGRLEINMTGNLTDHLFTAMYVSNTEDEITLTPEEIEIDGGFAGTKLLDRVVVFPKTSDLVIDEFGFNSGEKGLLHYYVSGLGPGIWKAVVDGVVRVNLHISEQSGFAYFVAPAGDVRIEPIEGVPAGNIVYNMMGGLLEGEVIYRYFADQTLVLPTNATHPSATFDGWYTTPTYEPGSEITTIYGDEQTGTVTVYAKWKNVRIIDADFSKEDAGINVSDGKSGTALGINFATNNKAGASFVSGTDENGSYILWTKGSKDSVITIKNTENNISTVGENQVSYHFVFSKNQESDLIEGHIRIMPRSPVTGKLGNDFKLITIGADGSVKLLGKTLIANAKTTDTVDIRMFIDFEVSKIYLYDENGKVISSAIFTPPLLDMDGEGKNNDSVSSLDFKKYMSEYVLYWYSNSNDADQSIKLRTVKLASGNLFSDEPAEKPTDGGIIYDIGGGELPSDAPIGYYKNEITVLPIPTHSGGVFDGWYTSATFDEETRITEIDPEKYSGDVTVYAKWKNVKIIDADFSKEDAGINVSDGKSGAALGISFATKDKAGASFVSGTDGQGSYILWTKGSNDPVITVKNTSENISTVSENQVSYHIVFSKNGDNDLIAGDIRLYPRSPVANASGTKVLGNSFSFITISADGSIKLLGQTVANAKEVDIVDLRILIDFEVSKIYLYDKDGKVTKSAVFTPSKVDVDGDGTKDAVSSLDFKKYMSEYVLYWYSNSKDANQSVKIRTIKLAGGNIFSDEPAEKPVYGGIIYELAGGTLPPDAPTEYYEDAITVLPTPTHSGGVFVGWYTSATFDEETRITVIDPQKHTGSVTVYAKWNLVLINSDYSDAGINIDATEKWASAAGIAYDANGKAGASYKTVDDGNGGKYLVWTVGTADPSMNLKGDGNDLTNSDSSVIFFTFKLSKNGTDNLPANISARFIANRDVDGETISSKEISFFTIKNGEIKLGGKEVIGELSESITELRIVVDFDALTFTAYTTDGKVKSTVSFDIPTATKAETGRELMKCITGRIINIYNSTSSLGGSVRFYGIKVEEGNPFKI